MLTKQKNPYRIEWTSFTNGERMPFLVQASTGLPIQSVSYWTTAERRAADIQANTIANELRSLVYLFLWADLRKVDIPDRLQRGEFLSLTEIVDLVNLCGRFIEDILSEFESLVPKVRPLRRAKRRAVKSGEKRNRLTAIYSYLQFTSAGFLSELQAWPARWDHYNAVRKECLGRLKGYRDAIVSARTSSMDGREGLVRTALIRMRDVIHPKHPDNPFRPSVRFRNYLLIRLLLELGIRRGELCGIKIHDCVFGSEVFIQIHRRPDDPDDDRKTKAATKTLARELAVGGGLASLLHEWAVQHRPKLPVAREHDFLIVRLPDGEKMTLDNVNKIFRRLRQCVSGLPSDLSPHVLRHTWNDLFSDTMDRNRVLPEEEEKLRMHNMGWSSAQSAKFYHKRTVKRRSNSALKDMQDRMEADTSASGVINGSDG